MSTEPSPRAREEPPTDRRCWDWLRVLLGAVYLLGGLAHVALGVLSPEVYERFADQALVDAYADAWNSLVAPNTAVLVPLVATFEFAVGAALLWRGRAVRTGHAAAGLFQAALILSGPWGPVNAVLAAVHAAAARRTYPDPVVDFGRLRNRLTDPL
jgi:hypothetical protein